MILIKLDARDRCPLGAITDCVNTFLKSLLFCVATKSKYPKNI